MTVGLLLYTPAETTAACVANIRGKQVSEPTYRDAAQWLPVDVREAIEGSLPCREGGAHDWDHRATDLHEWGQMEPVARIEHWQCSGCGLYRTTDPEAGK